MNIKEMAQGIRAKKFSVSRPFPYNLHYIVEGEKDGTSFILTTEGNLLYKTGKPMLDADRICIQEALDSLP